MEASDGSVVGPSRGMKELDKDIRCVIHLKETHQSPW